MISKFYFAILEKDTNKMVVSTEPRDTRDIVSKFLDRFSSKGVGIFRGTTHVRADARAALEEIIFELKAQVPPSKNQAQ